MGIMRDIALVEKFDLEHLQSFISDMQNNISIKIDISDMIASSISMPLPTKNFCQKFYTLMLDTIKIRLIIN